MNEVTTVIGGLSSVVGEEAVYYDVGASIVVEDETAPDVFASILRKTFNKIAGHIDGKLIPMAIEDVQNVKDFSRKE